MRNINHNLVYLLIVLFTLTYSCKKNVYEQPIDSEILVEAVERDGSIHILAETVKNYPYLNYPIEYSDRKLASSVTIKFKYIGEIEGGFTALGPATCEVNLGTLDKESYSVKFKLDGETTEGTLFTNPLKLEISETSNVRMKK